MKTKGLVHSLFLAFVLAVGFAAIWTVVGIWAAEVRAYIRRDSTDVEVLGFRSDGTPIVMSRVGQHREYRDLQGNAIELPEEDYRSVLHPIPLPVKQPIGSEEPSWDDRIRSFADGRTPSGFWYFISDGKRDGTGYFVGYDSESRACLGYLGTAGLRETPPPAEERIPVAGAVSGVNRRVYCTQQDHSPTEHPVQRSNSRAPRGSASPWHVYILGSDGKLYHADLKSRTVSVSFAEDKVLSATLVAGLPHPVHGAPHQPVVRTEDAVFVLDECGQTLRRFAIPESLRGGAIAFAETEGGGAVMYWSSPEDFLASWVRYRICIVDASGRASQVETTLPYPGMGEFRTLVGFVLPSPVGLISTVAMWRTQNLLAEGQEATRSAALIRALIEFAPAIALAGLLAMGLALLCYRRQALYGAGRKERIVWPLFVLLLGLPGWIGYRFGRRWSALDKCPECGVVVPRDRLACARCEVKFARPALKGIEVFA
jgi:hypothetical protein